jgi:ribonuclease HI
MSLPSPPYIGFVDGASRSTQDLTSVAWEIYAPTNELNSVHDVYLSRATKNIIEYSAVIELLIDTISLGIHHIVVRIDL